MRILRWPESAERRRSFVTLSRAVSVLCFGRKPDWNGSKRLLELRWVWSCAAMTRSRILDRKGRLDMGRKFAGLSGSRPGFFSIGVIAASLRDCGKEPEVREELMILVIRGEIMGRQVLMRGEGMGSREQVGVLILDRSLVSCTDVMGVK